MPNRSLASLTPEFEVDVELLLSRCRSRGVVMRPYCTTRSPLEQAKLWRQSRTGETIGAKIAELRTLGATYLASCLIEAGPQYGPHVTNALPGLSWHQWGEAVDCFWEREEGRAEWSTGKLGVDGGENGYRAYAEIAEEIGLTAGGLWRRFKDWPHVQSKGVGVMSWCREWDDSDADVWVRVDMEMQQRWQERR